MMRYAHRRMPVTLAVLVAAIFMIAGLLVVVLAEPINQFEHRLIQKYPKLRVTTWTGTPRGRMAWRILGVACLLIGAAYGALPIVFHLGR